MIFNKKINNLDFEIDLSCLPPPSPVVYLHKAGTLITKAFDVEELSKPVQLGNLK